MPDGRAEQQEIVLATYTDVAGRAVAEVRDNGPGIPPERLSRIFEPFFSTKSGSFGMGLGLAISHNIVISCGGEIEVESTMGRGTVFRIAFLPVRSLGAAAPAVDGPIASTSGARRGRILIVDDEVALGRALERILQGGHDVTLVSSGAEALARIAGGAPYDIVFCDLMMPVMSGVDVYETLVAANPEQARRMVFMTGGAFSLQAERFVASTLSTVVEKPFVPTTVRAIAADFVR